MHTKPDDPLSTEKSGRLENRQYLMIYTEFSCYIFNYITSCRMHLHQQGSSCLQKASNSTPESWQSFQQQLGALCHRRNAQINIVTSSKKNILEHIFTMMIPISFVEESDNGKSAKLACSCTASSFVKSSSPLTAAAKKKGGIPQACWLKRWN